MGVDAWKQRKGVVACPKCKAGIHLPPLLPASRMVGDTRLPYIQSRMVGDKPLPTCSVRR